MGELTKPANSSRQPYQPSAAEWPAIYEMLCGHCDRQLNCAVVDDMIEMKSGGAWPTGGWVTDPGAEVTCLSYAPKPVRRLPRQQLRALRRTPDVRLPPTCDGCAAKRGSEASASLHTQRDFQAAVAGRSTFLCHETGKLCGGWCRAISKRTALPAPPLKAEV